MNYLPVEIIAQRSEAMEDKMLKWFKALLVLPSRGTMKAHDATWMEWFFVVDALED
jgi:hypothetical protein